MLTTDFDFELPETAIAQQPAPRGESRLLLLDRAGDDRHRYVRDLPRLLRPGDLLVLNNTRVIPARLFGRAGEAKVEVFLVEPTGDREWDVLTRPGRKTRPGARVDFADGLTAEVLSVGDDGRRRVRFSDDVEPHLERLGHVPLPPYIKRTDTDTDRERYQTVYASRPGAVAAPTAGLHFSTGLLAELRAAGIETAEVTLHVGIGTFKPVTAELLHEHRMDAERWEIPEAAATALRAARERGGRVVAVGTTVVRTLESAALESGGIRAGGGSTRLFITPGFRFQAVDALLTNFHLPRSTLLMLVAAFAGQERVLAAYREAIAAGYRFYSYGDAMLLERA